MATTITDVSLAREVAFLNARAAALGARLANEALAPLGLKVRSYSVLSLAAEATPPSQRELADFLQLDPSQIVSLVDDLEARGWVTRQLDAADRRVRVVVASESGIDVVRRAAAMTGAAEAQTLEALDDSERAQLVELLRRVAGLE